MQNVLSSLISFLMFPSVAGVILLFLLLILSSVLPIAGVGCLILIITISLLLRRVNETFLSVITKIPERAAAVKYYRPPAQVEAPS